MKSVLLACALLFSLMYSSRASANECAGNLIDYSVVRTQSGQTIGELALYYDSANGNNCAVFNHAGPTWGLQTFTEVMINDCNGGTCPSSSARDAGPYAYRAGPVRIYGRGRCIRASGSIRYQGYRFYGASANYCR